MDIRKTFHDHLRQIQNEILVMGSMVDKAIGRAMEALKNRDIKLANSVVTEDTRVNEERYSIEDKCISLIATQQPMAGDLRVIVSTLSISSELERIGDHAEGIAKIAATLSSDPPIKIPEELFDMAEWAQSMLRSSMDAFISRDEAAARRIVKDDDKVDTMYDKVFRQLVRIMADNPAAFDRVTRLVWVAHNLERSGDRVTNICERIVYITTGKMVEIGGSHY